MPKTPPAISRSGKIPDPLPCRLLPDLIGRSGVFLCLDYDGTLSEITSDPSRAWPVPGVRESLSALAACHDRISIAIVSGRAIVELRRLLAIDRGLFLIGVHGLEMMEPNGVKRRLLDLSECATEIQAVRSWLAEHLPAGAGFRIEDKQIAIALHYRNVESATAEAVRAKFEDYLADNACHLMAAAGKMVLEALPRAASKGHAVRLLLERADANRKPVYFGDDLTDEAAFLELRDRGITVMVGERRPSLALYRVDGPAAVAVILRELATLVVSPPGR